MGYIEPPSERAHGHVPTVRPPGLRPFSRAVHPTTVRLHHLAAPFWLPSSRHSVLCTRRHGWDMRSSPLVRAATTATRARAHAHVHVHVHVHVHARKCTRTCTHAHMHART